MGKQSLSSEGVKDLRVQKVIRKRFNIVTNQVQYLVKWQKIQNRCWVHCHDVSGDRHVKTYERYLRMAMKTLPASHPKGNFILFPSYGPTLPSSGLTVSEYLMSLYLSSIKEFVPVSEEPEEYKSARKALPQTSSPIKKVGDYFKHIYRSVEKRIFHMDDEIPEQNEEE